MTFGWQFDPEQAQALMGLRIRKQRSATASSATP